jgi:hypothetical protein
MRPILTFAATLALVAGLAGVADAQKLDKNGRCVDDKGRFAKAEMCKGPMYKLDKGGLCRDDKGRMAKKEMCKK